SDKFSQSPLFESEELWRVICHELAVNIYEHASATGFIAMRVVKPPLRPWCRATFNSPLGNLPPYFDAAFLELCITDAGQGFVNTLKKSFLQYPQHKDQAATLPVNILTFAFDELGTCKKDDESWITERHALGRILKIVAKYGGILKLRSGQA